MKYVKIGMIFLCSLFSSPALASSQVNGLVTNLSTASDGTVWFSHSGTRSGALPSCADPNGLWVFSAANTGGQAILASLLSAKASGKPVSIQGTGSCINDHESIAYIVFP